MSLSDYFHILNPNSRHRGSVRRFFKKNPNLSHAWVERFSHPTHLETLVEWALVENHLKIAVWGGDGTLSRVVDKLYHLNGLEKITLALIPAGTGNDFARQLQLTSWKKISSRLDRGETETGLFDLGLVQYPKGKRIFVNNAGFGRAKEALFRKRPQPLKDIAEFKENKIHVEWGTDKIHQFETWRAFFVMVFNAPFFNKGLYFSKDIDPADGLISAFIVPPQKRMKLLFKFIKSRLGGRMWDASIPRLDANFINVESEQDLFPQVDGEAVFEKGIRELEFSVLKGILKIEL